MSVATKGTTKGKRAEIAYNAELSSMKEMAHARRKYTLEFYWRIGRKAHKIVGQPEKYGKHTAEEIASALNIGWKKDNMSMAMKFTRLANLSTVRELMKCEHASWNVVSQWLRVPDDDKRDKLLQDILSGKVKYGNIDETVRRIMKKEDRRPKVPSTALNIFRKMESQAKVVLATVGWADKSIEMFNKLQDISQLKQSRSQLRSTLKNLSEAVEGMQAAIDKLEQLASK